MTRGRIAVLMPAVYDELDKELLSGIHAAATVIDYDTLVFTAVSAENDENYTRGENNIYELPFAADEHYIGWCDAVGNGLDIVIKKSNTEYIWQKLEEKNMSDIYTGLHSRRGFVSKINAGDTIMLFSFPKRYMNTPYFVPIVSAVLRSDEDVGAAVYLGETVFAVMLEEKGAAVFTGRLCQAVSELGIYTSENEIYSISDKILTDTDADMRITELYYQLIEKGTPRSIEAYSEIFSSLRKEMKYSPQNGA